MIANPILWFIQHYLWDLSNAPDIRQEELDAWDQGYQTVNRDIAEAVLAQIEGQEQPLVMLHDYHLYTAPRMIRDVRPDAFLHHFVHIPWSQPDSWRVLPTRIREAIFDGMLANDIIGFHTHRLLHQLPALLRRTAGRRGGRLRGRRGPATPAAAPWPAPTRWGSTPSGCSGRRHRRRWRRRSARCSSAGANT